MTTAGLMMLHQVGNIKSLLFGAGGAKETLEDGTSRALSWSQFCEGVPSGGPDIRSEHSFRVYAADAMLFKPLPKTLLAAPTCPNIGC